MGRFIIMLILVAIIGVLGLLLYAYSGLLQPPAQEITQPVDLDGG